MRHAPARGSQARKHLKTDPEEMVRICNGLLDHSPADADLEQAIRVGDVFALMIEYYHGIQNYKSAYQLIEKMQVSRWTQAKHCATPTFAYFR